MPTLKSLEPANVTLFGKRVIAEVIKLRILDEIILDYLGGPQSNTKCSYERKSEGDLRQEKTIWPQKQR